MGVIYVRTNKFNGKQYVGKATDLEARQKDWKRLSQSYAGPIINRARAKYGLDAFDFEILKECEDDELDYWEMYYIKELNTKAPYGYNLTNGGDGGNTYICKNAEEMNIIKQKISESNKGEKNHMYGKHHTEETKKKIIKALKGRKRKPHSEETKRKISESNKGKIFSEETKNKISESRKGEKNWNYGKHHSEETKRKISESNKNGKWSKIVIQIDKSTYETIAEFPSASEAERQLGYSQANISRCCSGKIKSAYGYIWKYKESAA